MTDQPRDLEYITAPSGLRTPVSIILCARPCYAEHGESQGNGIDDPFDTFRTIVDELVTAYRGKLLLGDDGEILAGFSEAEGAFCCTQAIQQAIAATNGDQRPYLGVRIGCFGFEPNCDSQFGLDRAIRSSRDMVLRAAPGQTVTCKSALDRLNGKLLGETQPLDPREWASDRTSLGYPLFLVQWHEELSTCIANPMRRANVITRIDEVHLRWRAESFVFTRDSDKLTIGRGNQADICIESRYASRIHVTLRYQHPGFVLTDCSTNGTYVRIDQDDEIFLHDDGLVLRGKGSISLGRRASAAKGKVVFFHTERAGPPEQNGGSSQ